MRIGTMMVAASFVSGAASVPGHDSFDDTTRAVLSLERQYVDAWRRVDVDFIDRTTAPDATWINGSGVLATKEESIELYRSGRIVLDISEESELAVRQYHDTAIVTGLWAMTGKRGGRPQAGRMRFTRVWIKRDGQWQMAAWQATNLPD